MAPMADRPTIVHLIYALDTGGCEQQLLRILPSVADFSHHIITLHHPGQLANRFEEAGISVSTVSWTNIFDIKSYHRLINKIKKISPDVVMTYLFHADVIGRLVILPLTHVKPIPWLRTTYNSLDPRFLTTRIFEWLSKPLVTDYVANSKAVKDYYVKRLGVGKERVTVIPNAIDTDTYSKNNQSIDQAIRQKMGINEDAFIVTCVANLHASKGYTYLLEAFAEIASAKPNVHLFIVGEGEQRQTLEKQALSYGTKNRIHFLGQIEDVLSILYTSNLFTFPSLFEGMSNALMEAAASCCPIVATDIPENRALLKDALFVPVKNSSALREAILFVINNPVAAREIAQKNFAHIRENHSILTVSKKLSVFWLKKVREHSQ